MKRAFSQFDHMYETNLTHIKSYFKESNIRHRALWVCLILFLTMLQGKVWGQATPDRFWYKGDATVPYNGTTWDDETANNNHAVRKNGTIPLVANSVNFNPTLTFTNAIQQMQINTSVSVRSFIVVNYNTMTAQASGLIGENGDPGIRLTSGGGSWRGDSNGDDWSQNNSAQSRINGSTGWLFNKWHIVNQSRSSANSGQYYIGGYYNSSERPFTGSIAEVMAFSGTITNQARIESYLAVKYGITMGTTASPVSYLRSDGTTIWTGSGTYQNDVHGIGRDDITGGGWGLNQLSSKSENPGTDILTIQSGSSFITPTNAQTGTVLTNLQFFMTGHNGSGTTTFADLGTSGLYKVIPRKWYAQVTNNLPTESFQVNLAGATIPATYANIGMLVADDANFTSNLRFVNGTLAGNTLTVNNAAITNGKYFTVATYVLPSTPPSSITGTSSFCGEGSTTLTTAGGSLGSDAKDVWYQGACASEAYTNEWSAQPFIPISTTVNSVTGGILNVTSTTNDPMIDMTGLGSFDPLTYRYVQIRYQVTGGTGGSAEIFFYNTTHNYAVGLEEVGGALISDGAWHFLNIDMWSDPDYKTGGNILGWRFDWASEPGVTMNIDFITLADQPLFEVGPTITVSPTTSTTYFTRKKGAANSTVCASLMVTVNPLPIYTATVNSNISCNGGADGKINITITNANASPYSFSKNNGADNYTQSFTGSYPNFTLTGLPAGSYQIRVKDGNGCESPAIP